VEQLEDRCLLSAYRTIDGTGNNLANPSQGAANTQLLRNTTVGYTDGISVPGGADRPSARVVSNGVIAQGSLDLPSERSLSGYVFQWGQFLDHDLDLSSSASPTEPFFIPVPPDDPFLDPAVTPFIGLFRSKFDSATGTGTDNPRQQMNDITSYIDGSMVYGSDDVRALALRTGDGGRLKTGDGDLMPFNTLGLPNGNPTGLPADQLFVAGDVRSNETIALTAIHTLFVREHNYWADRVAAEHSDWSDEQIYQRARKIVGAEIEVITYNEFLPAVLGPNRLRPYDGYNPDVSASVSNVFATAGFRVGHTMLPPTLLRLGPDGNPISEGNVALRDAFFRPDRITDEGGIEPILRGLAFQIQQEIDSKIVDDVRNFLFDNPAGVFAVDLASLNIQRGREHGLPSYNQTRIDFGLAPVNSFAEITSDVSVQAALASTYGDVDNIDLWVGGISEDHLGGSSMGPLFTAIWVDQFQRSRDGDRFYYENDPAFSRSDVAHLRNTTLADIIERNTGISRLQPNVFLVRGNSLQALTAGATAPEPVTEPLSAGRLQPLLTEVIARWSAAGATSATFSTVDVRIAKASGDTLGMALGHTIRLDDNAGRGWFIDATPGSGSEYLKPGATGQRRAPTPSVAQLEPAVFDLIFIEERQEHGPDAGADIKPMRFVR
jgi:hypothetical protein